MANDKSGNRMQPRWLLLPAISLFLGIAAQPAPAPETCYDYCLKAGGVGSCAVRCSPGGDLDSTHAGNVAAWGAIAYSSKDQGAGWSFGWNDLDKAKKIALENCSARGSACKLWLWFNHGCGALAADGEKVTWGTAPAKQSADQRALLECKKAGGTKCVIQVSQCSR
jgi:hypothetical protein